MLLTEKLEPSGNVTYRRFLDRTLDAEEMLTSSDHPNSINTNIRTKPFEFRIISKLFNYTF